MHIVFDLQASVLIKLTIPGHFAHVELFEAAIDRRLKTIYMN